VFVIGSGGHAKVVIAGLLALGEVIEAVLDDDPQTHSNYVLGVPVKGGTEYLRLYPQPRAIIAVGSNHLRQQIARRFPNVTWVTLVHPRAWIDPSARIGQGSVVLAGAVVQAEALIGEHCIVNTSASVDHGCVLDRFVHLAPGVHLAGSVRVGEGGFCGIGSQAVPGVFIGAWSIVGAGATVTRSTPDLTVSVGTPARVIRKVDS
jgi:sugar O-acyltransferase (sialic acid O-acetyltransferase NeuD family)